MFFSTDLDSRPWSSVANELSNQVCSLHFHDFVLFQHAYHVKQLGEKPCNHRLPCRQRPAMIVRLRLYFKPVCANNRISMEL
jgi:hypothetical protein